MNAYELKCTHVFIMVIWCTV